jgi:site-specific recombinase XerD
MSTGRANRQTDLRYPIKFHKLPIAMQSECTEMLEHLTKVVLIDPYTMNAWGTGVIIRYMTWLHETKQRNTIDGAGARECLQWLSSLPQLKNSYILKMKQMLRHILRWQYVSGLVDADEIFKFDAAKSSSRHYDSQPPRALSNREMVDVFTNIATKWPYSPWAVDRYIRGIKIGERKIGMLRRSFLNVQYTTMIMVILETGVRLEELFNLTIDDLDVRNDSIRICGKNLKWRTVPYPEALKPVVTRWLSHRELIVEGRHKQMWVKLVQGTAYGEWHDPHTYKTLEHKITEIVGEAVTGKQKGWHIFRKTFATIRWKSGMDIAIISEILGHEDIKTTRKYLGLDIEHVLAASRETEVETSNMFHGMLAKANAVAKEMLADDDPDKYDKYLAS